jgi:release factor glutamine methyltransferase
VNLKQALSRARKVLAGLADADDPAFESEVLLRHVLNINRTQLFLDLGKELDPQAERLFREWVKRRSVGEPVAYIIGRCEFFGLDFYVDSRVLIPRPETELLVEEAINCAKGYLKANSSQNEITIADIGTGSGAVAVSIAANLPEAQIYATDISASAMEVALINCRRHKVTERIILLQGDLLDPLPAPVNILIANLPYVARAEVEQMPSAHYEPALALDGGEGGLDQIFRLCYQINGKLCSGGRVLLEIGLGQDKAVTYLLHDLFPSSEMKCLKDLAGINRAIILTFEE